MTRPWQRYDSPQVKIAVLIFNRDAKFVMKQRKDGYWSAPHGQVGAGETVREAAVRVAREEGLRIQGAQITAVTEEPKEEELIFWVKSVGSVEGVLARPDVRWIRWGDWPNPLWQPYWDNLFEALNSYQQVGMSGGIRP